MTHSGWFRSLWRTWKFSVSQSPGPVSSLPILQSLLVCTRYKPGMLFSLALPVGMRLLLLWAACKVWLCVRRGDGGLLFLGSDPVLSENAATEKQASFLQSRTWIDVACGFCCTASSCHHSARMLSLPAFPFFFPSLSLLARILTYITGW